MSEAAVRQAFADQSEVCAKLGSRFTGRLCGVLAHVLDKETEIGQRTLSWPGSPDALHDNIPLRLTGGLHALVRSGRAQILAQLYPPAPLADEATMTEAVRKTLLEEGEALLPWLDRAPQTNEVGRSALLMGGLLTIAAWFPPPMRLYELGASAGLNLLLDRFEYDLGGLRCGSLGGPLQLKPRWKGGSPPEADVSIVGRRGVDRDPIDAIEEGETLLAYVWPDQPDRMARLEAALTIAKSERPTVEKSDAADWLDANLRVEPLAGVTRVVLHSIAFQYFPPETQSRIRARIESAGAAARDDAPLAWLRFEMLPEDEKPSLRLRTWPGEERLLAWAHPHGSSVDWLEA